MAGMHQAHSDEQLSALVRSWECDCGLSVREQELLRDVIRQCNGVWAQESDNSNMKKGGPAKKKVVQKCNHSQQNVDDDALVGENEVTLALIIRQVWAEGKQKVTLTKRVVNMDKNG